MNAWLPALVTAAINLIVAVFVYGRLTQSVSDHDSRITTLERTTGRQWEKLSEHGERLASLESRSSR